MKVALITDTHTVELQQLDRPEPAVNEVRLRIQMAGICGSDIHVYNGDWQARTPFPVRIGHEGIGIIDAVGSEVTHLQVGQRVVVEPNYPCGHCRVCQRGQGNICPNKRIIGVMEPGCFAEYITVPSRFAWPVTDLVTNADAVLIEPTAVSWHALNMATLRPGDTIAVIGLGAIGLLLTHLALIAGYRVVVKDRITAKMDLAASWGAVPLLTPADHPVMPQFREQLSQYNVAAVFECGGTGETTTMALEAAPSGCEIIIVGLSTEPVSFTTLDLTRRGIQIYTSMIYDHPTDFAQVIDLVERGVIQPSRVISYQLPFDQIDEALARAANGHETKVVILIE